VIKKVMSVVLTLFVLSFIVLPPTQAANPENIIVGYDYPTKPGTTEWESFESLQEMIEACHIPDSQLTNMSTKELLETVSRYPLLINMYAFNSFQEGFESVKSYSNGMTALLNRKDVAKEALTTYVNFKRVDESNTFFKLHLLEIILSQKSILQQLSNEDILLLTQQIHEKYKSGSPLESFYSESALLLDRNSGDLLGELPSSSTLGEMVTVPVNGTPDGYVIYYIETVLTPKNSNVEVWKWSLYDYISNYRSTLDQYFQDAFPLATLERTSTVKYNCHSYAWYSQSSSNIRWMNDPTLYTLDGSYNYMGTNPSTPMVGWKMIYYPFDSVVAAPVHSAILAWSSRFVPVGSWEVRSKWGSGPLMYHKINYSPYSYKNPVWKFYKLAP